MTPERLILDQAGVTIGAARLLDGVSTTVEPGEHVMIVGPSGAGKTTLLRAVAGLVPLAEGRISHGDSLWSDRDGVHVPPEGRRIGMIAQDLALWPHLTALQHLVTTLRWRRVPRRRRRTEAEALLDRVEILDRADHRPAELSGGEAQRLALARALAGSTRILLLDEPFAQLDGPLRRRVAEQVHRAASVSGATVLHVTHDPDETRAVDRVLALQSGRLVRNDRPPAAP